MKRYMKLKNNMLVDDVIELLGTASRPNSRIEITHDNGEVHVYEIGQPDPPEHDPQCVPVCFSKQVDGKWVWMDVDRRHGWEGTGIAVDPVFLSASAIVE